MTKSDKRDEILRAALELIAENGFHGAPMALIAEHAGVGAGTIYRYFENKDVLINELFREVEARIYPFIMKDYALQKPISERFLLLSSATLRYFIENPLDFRYLEQFFNSPFGVVYRRDKLMGKKEGCDVFRELFEEGISRREVKDIPLVILFALAFGPLLAVARDHILDFIQLDEHLIRLTVNACWDSVKQ
jgi:TetR/AcrR family transcriptional regulator, repressor of fatR-cypB operon